MAVNDREEVTVQKMVTVHRKGPVFYASLPFAVGTRTTPDVDREDAKQLLVSSLWRHFLARERPLWHHHHCTNTAALSLQVVYSPLGRPHLRWGNDPGAAISFSEGGGKIWAALYGGEADIGIDVAGSEEFHRAYPLQRVFLPQELEHAMRLTGGDLQEASALLWSVKEAVAKALGCAFHLVAPEQISVYPSVGEGTGWAGGYAFPVRLTGKAQERFPIAADGTLGAQAIFQRKMWLSIALLERSPIRHE